MIVALVMVAVSLSPGVRRAIRVLAVAAAALGLHGIWVHAHANFEAGPLAAHDWRRAAVAPAPADALEVVNA